MVDYQILGGKKPFLPFWSQSLPQFLLVTIFTSVPFGHYHYHSKRKPTKQGVGTMIYGIIVKDMTMLFWEDYERVWNSGLGKLLSLQSLRYYCGA